MILSTAVHHSQTEQQNGAPREPKCTSGVPTAPSPAGQLRRHRDESAGQGAGALAAGVGNQWEGAGELDGFGHFS